MLSAAHVLAMDAKNLLDVVDSLRLRHPELFLNDSIATPLTPTTISSHFDMKPIVSSPSALTTQHHYNVQQHQQQDELLQRQTYENMSQIQNKVTAVINQNSPPSSLSMQHQQHQQYDCELYANQQQQQPDGLYDNECIINQQMKSLEIDNKNNVIPTKPPLAAKPPNLQQKLKALIPINSRQSIECNTSTTSSNSSNSNNKNGTDVSMIMDEPLKIIEDEQELYSNISNVCINNDDVNDETDTNNVVMTSLLPEPVPCAVVQENVFQKVMSNKMG